MKSTQHQKNSKQSRIVAIDSCLALFGNRQYGATTRESSGEKYPRTLFLVVEEVLYRGLNKSQCMDCTPGQKKLGRCGKVALSGRSTVAVSQTAQNLIFISHLKIGRTDSYRTLDIFTWVNKSEH